jgi:hypothetical protein
MDADDHEERVDIIDPELLKGRDLSEEQLARIQALQDEITEIWSTPGSYKIDPDAWESMPMFMDDITDKDVAEYDAVAALSNVMFVEVPAEEVADKCKGEGNKFVQLALTATVILQKKNYGRSAVKSYTEALQAKCADRKMNAMIYANRSMAHWVLENFGHGIEDAQKSIVLDRNYTKAYYRGAKCAVSIKKNDLARKLIDLGLKTDPPPTEQTLAEFDAILKACDENDAYAAKVARKHKIKERSAAAGSNQLVRKIEAFGIAVGSRCEVSSDQWAQFGSKLPHIEDDGTLHVPMLFLYDEYSQSDFMADVAADCTVGEVVTELLPFPWDTQQRYTDLRAMWIFYKIDDGVKMPEHYAVGLDDQLIEVFRSGKYLMPGLVPTLHILPKNSDYAKQCGLE